MSMKSIGFVGGGRIAKILLGGWKRAGKLPESIIVSDVDGAALDRLKAEFPSIATVHHGNHEAAAQDVVLFALHPPAFAVGLAEIASSLRPEALLVSLAPKWTMSRISETLNGFNRLARIIPNAPSIVNQGYNPVCFCDNLPMNARQEILWLIEPWGACPKVAEETLEAYAIIAAMGPTYLWYQLYQLMELGQEFGLTREAAKTAVVGMMTGALKTMTESGLAKEAVIDLIPVKPLAGIETMVKEAYTSTLADLHRKLKA